MEWIKEFKSFYLVVLLEQLNVGKVVRFSIDLVVDFATVSSQTLHRESRG